MQRKYKQIPPPPHSLDGIPHYSYASLTFKHFPTFKRQGKKNGTCAHESFLFESSYAFISEGRCLIIKKTSLILIMIEKQAIKIFCSEKIFLNIILFLEILNDWGIYCFSSKYICIYVYTWWSLFNMCMLDQFKLNTETRPCKKKTTPKTMKISD